MAIIGDSKSHDEGSIPSTPAKLSQIKGWVMSEKNYNTIMFLLDLLEIELDKVSVSVGHETFSEFMEKKNG